MDFYWLVYVSNVISHPVYVTIYRICTGSFFGCDSVNIVFSSGFCVFESLRLFLVGVFGFGLLF